MIAETTDLRTKYAKIVVTDDQGRYVIPDLPRASYQVFVRGYGLVDSARVPAKPGRRTRSEGDGRAGRRSRGDLSAELLVGAVGGPATTRTSVTAARPVTRSETRRHGRSREARHLRFQQPRGMGSPRQNRSRRRHDGGRLHARMVKIASYTRSGPMRSRPARCRRRCRRGRPASNVMRSSRCGTGRRRCRSCTTRLPAFTTIPSCCPTPRSGEYPTATTSCPGWTRSSTPPARWRIPTGNAKPAMRKGLASPTGARKRSGSPRDSRAAWRSTRPGASGTPRRIAARLGLRRWPGARRQHAAGVLHRDVHQQVRPVLSAATAERQAGGLLRSEDQKFGMIDTCFTTDHNHLREDDKLFFGSADVIGWVDITAWDKTKNHDSHRAGCRASSTTTGTARSPSRGPSPGRRPIPPRIGASGWATAAISRR